MHYEKESSKFLKKQISYLSKKEKVSKIIVFKGFQLAIKCISSAFELFSKILRLNSFYELLSCKSCRLQKCTLFDPDWAGFFWH